MNRAIDKFMLIHTRSLEVFLGFSTFMAGLCILLDGKHGGIAEIVATLSEEHGGRIYIGAVASLIGLFEVISCFVPTKVLRLASAILCVPFWAHIFYHTIQYYQYSFSPYMSFCVIVGYIVILIHRAAVK